MADWQPSSFIPDPPPAQTGAGQNAPPDNGAGTSSWQPSSFVPDPAPAKTSSVSDADTSGVPEMFQDKPGMYYGNILPFARNEKTGETSLALPEPVRAIGRGVTSLMQRSAGEYQPATEEQNSGPLAPLNADEFNALTSLSPLSAAKGAPSLAAQTLETTGSKAANILRRTAEGPVRMAQNLRQGWNALDAKGLSEDLAAQQQGVDDAYAAARANGAVFNADKMARIKDVANSALKNSGVVPAYAPVSHGVVKNIIADVDSGELDLNRMDQHISELRNASGSDAAAAGALRKSLRNEIQNTTTEDLANGTPEAVNLFNTARAQAARTFSLGDVADVLKKANGNPKLLRSGLTRFLADDDNLKGLTDPEIDSLRTAASQSAPGKILQMLGRFGFDLHPSNPGNTLIPWLALAAERESVPGAISYGAPFVAVGTAARSAETLLARAKGQQAYDLIKNRPLPSFSAPEDEPFFAPGETTGGTPPALPTPQAKGGRVAAKTHTGKVIKKPVSYPALEARRKKP